MRRRVLQTRFAVVKQGGAKQHISDGSPVKNRLTIRVRRFLRFLYFFEKCCFDIYLTSTEEIAVFGFVRRSVKVFVVEWIFPFACQKFVRINSGE